MPEGRIRNGFAAAVVLLLLLPAWAGADTTSRVSEGRLDPDERSGDFEDGIAVSGDGRFVAFQSAATNLVSGDANATDDIFVLDRITNETTRVSVTSAGVEAAGDSSDPAISSDGRFVAFVSEAALDAADANVERDIYVHDRLDGTTVRASVSSAGIEANERSVNPSISGDGRYVVFESRADNLVAGDANATFDIFLRDLVAGTTTRVSVTDAGAEANGGSEDPWISRDGTQVSFTSGASNLTGADANPARDVFVRDLVAGTTVLVSLSSAGVQGNRQSIRAKLSADGRFVAFNSDADNLAPGTSSDFTSVYVHDRDRDGDGVFDEQAEPGGISTVQVDVASDGTPGNDFSFEVAISDDGRYVGFQSVSTNLVPDDTNGRSDIFLHDRDADEDGSYDEPGGIEVRRVSVDGFGAEGDGWVEEAVALDGEGRHVAFVSSSTNLDPSDGNSVPDVFLHDAWSGGTGRASFVQTEANDMSEEFDDLSPDGRFVVFECDADNLVPGDANMERDVFLFDREPGTMERISVNAGGAGGNGFSFHGTTSDDGAYVAFGSAADNLDAAPDDNNADDAFLRDRAANTTELVSLSYDENQANQGIVTASRVVISGDGLSVAFESESTNLVPQPDDNEAADIFVRDLAGATTVRVSVDSSGNESNDTSFQISLSADGRHVAFTSAATNLVAGDTNNATDVFVHDRDTGATVRVSIPDGGGQGDGGSFVPDLSEDGRYVTFVSNATNLVPGDTNAVADVFVHDRDADEDGIFDEQGDPNATSTEIVSVNDAGQIGDDGSDFWTAIGADGRFVVFLSFATNLSAEPDANAVRDVFLRDRLNGTTERVSVSTEGSEANNGSLRAFVSRDGRVVVFDADATNLVPDDGNDVADVFLRLRSPAGPGPPKVPSLSWPGLLALGAAVLAVGCLRPATRHRRQV